MNEEECISAGPIRSPWAARLAWVYLAALLLVWALGEWPAERTVPTLLLAYAPPALFLLPGLGLALLLVWARAARLPVLLAALAGLGYSGFVWHPAGSPSPNQAGRAARNASRPRFRHRGPTS